MRFRSVNPALKHATKNPSYASEYPATYSGVIGKSALLLAVMTVFGLFSASIVMGQGDISSTAIIFVFISPVLALISVFIAMRNTRSTPFFAMLYAVCQGIFVGFLSGMYEVSFGNGIVATAMLATIGVFSAMLVLYASGMVRVTDFMRRALFTVLLGLLFSSFMLMFLFWFQVIPGADMLTIIFAITVIAVIVASLYLLVDFDNIKKVVDAGADKSYEWVLSLGLIITLVWLYIELLRLIAILRMRD